MTETETTFKPAEFKQDDIKSCALCKRGIAHNNPVGIFWRLKIERLMLDHVAISRHAGLEAMLGGGRGGAAIARVMGVDANLALSLTGPHEVLICEPCVMTSLIELFAITEKN